MSLPGHTELFSKAQLVVHLISLPLLSIIISLIHPLFLNPPIVWNLMSNSNIYLINKMLRFAAIPVNVTMHVQMKGLIS